MLKQSLISPKLNLERIRTTQGTLEGDYRKEFWVTLKQPSQDCTQHGRCDSHCGEDDALFSQSFLVCRRQSLPATLRPHAIRDEFYIAGREEWWDNQTRVLPHPFCEGLLTVSKHSCRVPRPSLPHPFCEGPLTVSKHSCDELLQADTAEFMKMVAVWLSRQSFPTPPTLTVGPSCLLASCNYHCHEHQSCLSSLNFSYNSIANTIQHP